MDNRELHQLVAVISAAAETRDFYTAKHQSRVSNLARLIAQELNLPNEQIEYIRISGLLHDIGKLGVPSAILSKAGKLRKEEFELIKLHSTIGEDILKKVDFEWPVSTIVRQHHERLDGSGYPDGLTANEIMIEAKIIAVADVIDSMSASRAYRQSLGLAAAIDEIVTNKGILYDSEVVDACYKLYQKHDTDILNFENIWRPQNNQVT